MNRLIEQHYAAFVSRESNNPGDRDLEREYILYEAGYKANKSRHSKEVIFRIFQGIDMYTEGTFGNHQVEHFAHFRTSKSRTVK